MGTIETIEHALRLAFSPQELAIRDDSAHHRGHQAMGGRVARETHIHIHIVSDVFIGLTPIARQRAVHKVLAPWMTKAGGLHAVSLDIAPPSRDVTLP
ncbi:MAG: BolA family transcriptional regulator [Alphaproteobacteria bacterium GM7ARS4]|nr:BolA family transcriptional regulator [Alphaproteobacteria bacterium GM7ARS4]